MRTRQHLTKNLTKVAATVALVAGAAGVAGVGTFGAYTDTTSADTQVGSGKVSVLMNGFPNGVTVTKSNMAAGDVAYVPITIEREQGSLALSALKVSSTVGGDLAGTLRLKVETCTAQVSADGKTCTGSQQLYDGLLSGSGPVTNYPLPADWVTKLNADTKIYLRATLTLPTTAPNDTQAKSATVSWSLLGEQRALETTVATPVEKP